MPIGNVERAGLSVRLSAISSERRRQALDVLQEAGEPLSMADLAIELVRRETDHETIGAECEHVEELQLVLHHIHVPKLADAGLVEYGANRRTVSLTETGTELIALVDRMMLPTE